MHSVMSHCSLALRGNQAERHNFQDERRCAPICLIALWPCVETKLSVTTFTTNVDGLRYVSLLSGPAWKLASPRIPSAINGRQCYNPFEDIEQLTTELLDRFGEINTENKAWSALMSIKQRPNESFSDFYAKYMEYRSQIPNMGDAQELDRQHGLVGGEERSR